MLKKLGILALGAGVVIAVSSTISWGGSNAKLPTKAESFELMRGHPVASPSVGSSAKAAKAKKPRLKYFETNVFSVPADGRRDVFLRCPRKYKAINGYFGTDGGIFPDYLASGQSVRRWDYGLADTTGLQGRAFIGIVCLKGTR
jgi:hypothetical protein